MTGWVADREALRKALKPFAKAADNYADCRDDGKYLDDDATITVGDLREARAALVTQQPTARMDQDAFLELAHLETRKRYRALMAAGFVDSFVEGAKWATALAQQPNQRGETETIPDREIRKGRIDSILSKRWNYDENDHVPRWQLPEMIVEVIVALAADPDQQSERTK